jgi:hypothetical protein
LTAFWKASEGPMWRLSNAETALLLTLIVGALAWALLA